MHRSLISHVSTPVAKLVGSHRWLTLTVIRRYPFKKERKKKGNSQMQKQIICTIYVPENMTVEDEWGTRWWVGGVEQAKCWGRIQRGNSCRLHFLYTSAAIPISVWIFYLQCSDGYQLAEEILLLHVCVCQPHTAGTRLCFSTSECFRCSSCNVANSTSSMHGSCTCARLLSSA